MRKMKSSPICILIWRRVRETEPVSAICSGKGVVRVMVLSTRSSNREVWWLLVSTLPNYDTVD